MSNKYSNMEKSNSLTKPRQANGSALPPALPLPPPPAAPAKKCDSTFTPNLVAKSPPSSDKYHPLTSTLKTRCSDETNGSGGGASGERDANQLLVFGGIQMMCGLLMGVFGVLTLLHDASMAELGGGLWSGAVAMSTGMVAVMTGLKSCYNPVDSVSTMGVTTYLAMCLVTIAVSNLALVLTSTGLVRDSQRPNYYAPIAEDVTEVDYSSTNWAPILANLGLLLATALLCLTTVVAVFRVYRLVCPCVRGSDRRLLAADSPASSCSSSSKQRLVSHWLGQQSAVFHTPPTPQNLIVYPPPLIMEGPQQIYAVPAPSSLGYTPHIAAMHANAYHQRRRSSHRPPPRDTSVWEDTRQRRRKDAQKKVEERERVEKPKEVTEEELEKTYTGLDREIAEEFISIAMQPKQDGVTNGGVSSHTVEKPNRVIGCITNME